MPEGWRVPSLRMRRISCRLRLSLVSDMGQRALIFISETQWQPEVKCLAGKMKTRALWWGYSYYTRHISFALSVCTKFLYRDWKNRKNFQPFQQDLIQPRFKKILVWYGIFCPFQTLKFSWAKLSFYGLKSLLNLFSFNSAHEKFDPLDNSYGALKQLYHLVVIEYHFKLSTASVPFILWDSSRSSSPVEKLQTAKKIFRGKPFYLLVVKEEEEVKNQYGQCTGDE